MGNICKKNRSNRIRIGACHGPETLAAVLIRADPARFCVLRSQTFGLLGQWCFRLGFVGFFFAKRIEREERR